MIRRSVIVLISFILIVCLNAFPVLASDVIKFDDVAEGKYYYDAVNWAVEKGITNGTGGNSFSPDKDCTRAEVVTFLWRAKGSPAPASNRCPFNDVDNGWYYDAVLWAVENGITNGTSDKTFSPGRIVTRSEFVTFLWRAMEEPGVSKSYDFDDVVSGSWYYNAVMWAADAGVTMGTGNNQFSPSMSCSRGQTVTFLYRAMVNGEEQQPVVESLTKLVSEPVPMELVSAWDGMEYSWRFVAQFNNDTSFRLKLTKLEIINLMDGNESGDPFVLQGNELGNLPFALEVAAGDQYYFEDYHPVVDYFNGREYILTFEDSYGTEYRLEYLCDLIISKESLEAMYGSYDSYSAETEKLTVYTNLAGDRWDFEVGFLNSTGTKLTMEKLVIVNLRDGEPMDTPFVFEGDQLNTLSSTKVIPSMMPFRFNDGHPVVDAFDGRTYTFTFRGENGKTYTKEYLIDFSMESDPDDMILPDYSSDNGRDLRSLRHNASFSVKVADELYWVPAVSLGKSDYTNAQIQAMLTDSPEKKQEKVDTLYEALQLFQISGFFSSDDNVRIVDDGIDWEHHKPGYHCVRTNNGCCASCANWLNYILKDDYDEVGFIATSQRDGNGHIFNYIKEDGLYYFVDLTKWYPALEQQFSSAVESGDLDDYRNSDFVNANIHKTTSVAAFVDYVQESYTEPPGLMFQYTASDCLAVTCLHDVNHKTILYEEKAGVNIKVIFDDPSDSLEYLRSGQPTSTNDYAAAKAFDFAGIKFQ